MLLRSLQLTAWSTSAHEESKPNISGERTLYRTSVTGRRLQFLFFMSIPYPISCCSERSDNVYHLPQWDSPYLVLAVEGITATVLWTFWTLAMRFLTLTWTRNWEWYPFEKSSMADGACLWLSVRHSNLSQQLILQWWTSYSKSNLDDKWAQLHHFLQRLTCSVPFLKSSFANCWMNLKRGIYCLSQLGMTQVFCGYTSTRVSHINKEDTRALEFTWNTIRTPE